MLATARDHKRAHDGDTGPNTGGMGAVSPAEVWGPDTAALVESEIMAPLIRGFVESGLDFRGLLFPGLMMTAEGPRVLEFNCRFGDPETQVILPRLKSDLLELLEATIDGNVQDVALVWDERPAVTVVMASGGYPGDYDTGKEIRGLDGCAGSDDVHVFHAGTRVDHGKVVTAGGRVLAVTALGATVEDARRRAYEAVARYRLRGRALPSAILPLPWGELRSQAYVAGRLPTFFRCAFFWRISRTPGPNAATLSRELADAVTFTDGHAFGDPVPDAHSAPAPDANSIVNAMSPADLQQTIQLLKTNYINPEALNETELNRALLSGILARLGTGVAILPEKCTGFIGSEQSVLRRGSRWAHWLHASRCADDGEPEVHGRQPGDVPWEESRCGRDRSPRQSGDQ